MNSREYVERVYAGVLGKIIGVYMGRPFEGWTYDRIINRFGEVDRFVNDEIGAPLVLTDDDIGGTFTFVRALEDYGYNNEITAEAIGQTWLNYIIYKRTVFWWGGLGNSTEHTAYLRLRDGVTAPASGSAALNGTIMANQIGAQIFIDGWALVSPGKPEQAARLARSAASVSHDEEAVNAAVVIAVLEASAFGESDIDRLLDTAMGLIPANSLIARQTADIRVFCRDHADWKEARAWLDEKYGYDRFRGVCHIVPNYGLIIMSLLYGHGDFRRSMMIVNTSGHDTDCNAGTLGCILGIRNGLAAIEACPDLRTPHRDLLYLPSADGGHCVSDAAREAFYLANVHFRMTGQPVLRPKDGARYHFDLPGSLHAFHAIEEDGLGLAVIQNLVAPRLGVRALQISIESEKPALVATPVFSMESRTIQYETQASPALYRGQVLRVTVVSDVSTVGSVHCRLFVSAFIAGDISKRFYGPETLLETGKAGSLSWKLDIDDGSVIFEAGIEVVASSRRPNKVFLLSMDWDGMPDCVFKRIRSNDQWWGKAWVNGVDEWNLQFPESYHISQNQGTGLLIQGTREWTDYEARATITPFLASQAGLAVRVQGMKRYYALLLCRDGFVRLIKERDGTTILAEMDFGVEEYHPYDCRIMMSHSTIRGIVNGRTLFEVVDTHDPLNSGALGLLLTEGTLTCDEVRILPLEGK
jgi:ADP-ribosylglycohydrolase